MNDTTTWAGMALFITQAAFGKLLWHGLLKCQSQIPDLPKSPQAELKSPQLDLGDLDVGTADARSVPRIQGEYVYWQVMSMVVFVAREFKRLDKIRGTRDALELK